MITVSGLAKSHGGRTLFSDVTLRLVPGRRVALVGGNGVGKTTILEIICGIQQADAGEVHVGKDTRIGYLPQELTEQVDGTVLDEVLRGAAHLTDLEEQLNRLAVDVAETGVGGSDPDPDAHDRALEAYGEAQHRFETLGGYGIESEAQRILVGPRVRSRRRRSSRRGPVGWMAHAGRARPADALRARPAGARRADQPPRRRIGRVARTAPPDVAGRDPVRQPRPRLHRRDRRAGRRGRGRTGDRVRRRVRRVRGPAGGPHRRGRGGRGRPSSARSPRPSGSSSGSATRRPRPVRSRAGSRRWPGSTRSRCPTARSSRPGSPSPSRSDRRGSWSRPRMRRSASTASRCSPTSTWWWSAARRWR